jgi:hypothetical protein
MAAVAAFAGTPTFDTFDNNYGRVTATTGGAGALSVCLAASAPAAVGTVPRSPRGGFTSSTVGVGAPDSTAAISLTIDCAATSELCRVRRPAPRTQPFLSDGGGHLCIDLYRGIPRITSDKKCYTIITVATRH